MTHLTSYKKVKIFLSINPPEARLFVITTKNAARYLEFNKSLIWCCKNFIDNYNIAPGSIVYAYIREHDCYEIWTEDKV